MFVKPSFYDEFRCKADKCTDSCCIGWEIDIDELSLEKYKNVSGEFGERLRRSIETQEDCSFFRLSENERCPFLCENGLCDIYINLGEDALCDICSEHPRFYNETDDITEAGLGLCCEKVCEMLFDDNYELKFVSDNKMQPSEIHNDILGIIECSDTDIIEKMNKIISVAGGLHKIEFNDEFRKNTVKSFLETEPINEEWTAFVSAMSDNVDNMDIDGINLYDKDYSKLLAYILYRNLPEMCYDINTLAYFCCISVSFVILCDCYILGSKGELLKSDRLENIRRWSKQTEYSTENKDIIISQF